MSTKQEIQYTVIVNGIPDFKSIPKEALEPIAKKVLEIILKTQKEKQED